MKIKKFKSEKETLECANKIKNGKDKLIKDILSDEDLRGIFEAVYLGITGEKSTNPITALISVLPALQLLELYGIIKINK